MGLITIFALLIRSHSSLRLRIGFPVAAILLPFLAVVSPSHGQDLEDILSRVTRAQADAGSQSLTDSAARLEDFLAQDANPEEIAEATRLLAEIFVSSGKPGSALAALQSSARQTLILVDSEKKAASLFQIARQLRSIGARSEAGDLLFEAQTILERQSQEQPLQDQASQEQSNRQQELLARLWLESASLAAETDNLFDADAFYRNALELIQPDNYQAIADTWAQLLKVQRYQSVPGPFDQTLAAFDSTIGQLADVELVADLKLQVAGVLIATNGLSDAGVEQTVVQYLSEVRRLESVSFSALAYALGYEGALAEYQGNLAQALDMTRQALNTSIENELTGQVYRWQWQLARIQRSADDTDSALRNYEAAVDSLARSQSQFTGLSGTVIRERITPVYYQYVDLLLELAARTADPTQTQVYLEKIQATLERMNRSEALEYFSDDCLFPTNFMSLDRTLNDTAIVYPVTFDEKLQVLLKTDTGLYLIDSGVALAEFTDTVARLRNLLTPVRPNVSLADIQQQASSLYDWLVRPYEARLESERVTNLVFVSMPVLRSIPMSVLFDGEEYLIQNYSIATSLGLQLTSSESEYSTASVLLGGISDAIGDFPALTNVESELMQIQSIVGSEPLLNNQFELDDISRLLAAGNYSVVHMATHAVFDSEPARSFLLTHDGMLTMGDLQETVGIRQFVDQPLDLLVLSACETAEGDDKAILGLAGVSLKAGARSTLASLWPVDDESTARLMVSFYEALAAGKTKSQALQAAQLQLLQFEEFQHPNFWSAFILIGNWN